MEFKELGKTNVKVPVLGLGTWGMGGRSSKYTGADHQAVQALRLGLDLGVLFIDTSEFYGHGHSEEIVAEAIAERRESVLLATKVSPEHFACDDVLKACEASLKRLRVGYVDLYQLHWPSSSIPIQETMKAMEYLVNQGKVRHIGVSNFSVRQTREAQESLSKATVAANQVEYSLLDRSIETELLQYCQRERITVIAYSPLAKSQIPQGGRGRKWHVLDEVAKKNGRTRSQVALNWLIAKDGVVAIPKAASTDHVKENAGAIGWTLSREDQMALEEAFG
jgi:diketogulonate reductase-like aldo/keto reductase